MKKLVLSQSEIDKFAVVERSEKVSKVHGAGSNDVCFQVSCDGLHFWQYYLWKGLIERSYNKAYKDKKPTYKDVTCCDEWLSFATFLEWVNKEVGYSGKPEGMELDKDLIIRGNKSYSPEACSFVPIEVNKLTLARDNDRGSCSLGVYQRDKKTFEARVCKYGKRVHLGTYATPEEAFQAYKVAKEAQIKAVANQHKHVLKPAVYESLMNWEIEP